MLESESEVAQSCLTLCDSMDYSLPGSSVHGIFQALVLEWICRFLLQGILLTQGSNPGLPHCRHFSSLIPRMSTFTLAISCLTTSNLP